MTAPVRTSVGSRTLRGMAWAYGAFVGQRLLTLISTALLARLLAPSAFGLVAIAMTFIMLLETISDFGLSQALVVVGPEEAEERASRVFSYSALIGMALTLATVALSPFAATYFNESELTRILPVLGSTIFVRALGNTHYALAQKRLDFRSRTAAEVADVGARGVVGISLALAGAGVWSLVLGYLAGALAMTATLWATVPWRPSRRRRAPLGTLVGFGTRLTAVNLLAALNSNVDYLFVGRVLGTGALGVYTLGFKLPELLIVQLSVVAGRVLFPAFAAIDRRELNSAFLRSMRYTMMLCLPLAAGLVILSAPLIEVAFGSRWAQSVPAMRLLTVYALATAIGIPGGTIYKATGRAEVILRMSVPRAVLTVVSIALFVHHGITAVAACQAATAVVISVVGVVLAVRLLNVRWADFRNAVRAPIFATAAASGVMLGATSLGGDPFPTLVMGIVAGGATYVVVLWLLAQESLRQLYEMAFGDRFRGISAVAAHGIPSVPAPHPAGPDPSPGAGAPIPDPGEPPAGAARMTD